LGVASKTQATWSKPPTRTPEPTNAATFQGTILLAYLALETGDKEKAEELWREADRRGDPTGAYNHGLSQLRMGNSLEAELALRRAHRAGHSAASEQLEGLLIERGDIGAAFQVVMQANSRHTSSGQPFKPIVNVQLPR